ncbi:hypothetical protein [Ruegeria sp. HKCCD8929]|uniref:hypothetical protein n=1 Tax=Ruegeria sp. HKCCD8929 TaxID=2683006 RepID=UPI0014896FE5|nr:hypothetical protein [Ruegeria sp. HKCCD8929]
MLLSRVLRTTFAALSVGIAFSQAATSETFDYEHDMQVRIGETWNPLSPYSRASLSSCFETTVPQEAPIAGNRIEERYVNNFSELEEKASVKITARGSTSFGLASVKASASLDTLKEAFNSNRSIVYSVVGTREYSAFFLEEADLNERGQKALDDANTTGDPEKFYRRCGRSLITSVRKKTTFSILYVFSFSDASSKERIETAISLSASSGSSSGEVSSNMLEEARKVDQSTSLDVLVFQDGVRDSSTTASSFLSIAPGEIRKVRVAVEKALNEVIFHNAPTIRFSADPISNFFDVPAESSWGYISNAYSSLDVLKTQADRIVRRYYKLQDIQSDVDRGLVTYKENMEAELLNEKQGLIARLANLASTARQCFDNPGVTCPTDELPIQTSFLKYIDVVFANNLGWRSRAFNNYYDSHGERIHRSASYWPVISVENLRLIRSIELSRNGSAVSYVAEDSLANFVSGGMLDFSPVWTSNHTKVDYCWRGDWTGCENWAKNTQGHMNELKGNEGGFQYFVTITDVEGGKTAVELGNASGTAF